MADKRIRRFRKRRRACALSGSEARFGDQNMQVWKEGRGKHLLQACETLPRSEAKDDRCGSVTVARSCPLLQRTTASRSDGELLHKLLLWFVQFRGVAAEEIDMEPILSRCERFERSNFVLKHDLLSRRETALVNKCELSAACGDGIAEPHNTWSDLGLLCVLRYYLPSVIDADHVR